MWAGTELNRRHMDFQSIALPTELPALQNLVRKNMEFLQIHKATRKLNLATLPLHSLRDFLVDQHLILFLQLCDKQVIAKE